MMQRSARRQQSPEQQKHEPQEKQVEEKIWKSQGPSSSKGKTSVAMMILCLAALFFLRQSLKVMVRHCRVSISDESDKKTISEQQNVEKKRQKKKKLLSIISTVPEILSNYSHSSPQTSFVRHHDPKNKKRDHFIDFPCARSESDWHKKQRTPARTGLLYVREMKTGSSTLAGVLLRLAYNRAPGAKQRKLENNNNLENNNDDETSNADILPNKRTGHLPCRVRLDHSPARTLDYLHRNKTNSFLMTMLRDPTQRLISQYFHFRVSKLKEDPLDANFQAFCQMRRFHNYYLNDLTLDPVRVKQHVALGMKWHDAVQSNQNDKAANLERTLTTYTMDMIQSILNDYDFIGITEQMDESLIVLKLLFNLDYQDLLYMSAKRHGTFSMGENATCVYITPAFITPGMRAFFEDSSSYQLHPHAPHAHINADVWLYRAAVKSLDNTIRGLGRARVAREVAIFRYVNARAQDLCHDETIFPCTERGDHVGFANSTCLLWAVGCGFQCLNRLDIGELVKEAERTVDMR